MRRRVGERRAVPALVCLAGALVLVLPSTARALRCGGDLVSVGDPAYQVREACGAPDHVKPLHGYPDPDRDYGDALWYYNRGPSQLLREVRMRDGRVDRIRTTDRGFRESREPGGCRPNDVGAGMTGYELRARCGEPVQRETRHAVRPLHRDGRVYGHHRVLIEDWYYDFGSQYLDRRVRLVDGRVESVDTVD